MAEQGHKIVYLLVEKGTNGNKKTYWRTAGVAYPCRDGSLNIKLDIHPGLTFNCRDPKSISEAEETDVETEDENDRVFPCDSCRIVVPNEEAHLLSGGGVVCEKCAETKYKTCGRCGNYFPKQIQGAHCPDCG